jgi:molybdate transport system ATP-binding protein
MMISLNIYKKLQGSVGEMPLHVNFSIKEHEFVALSGQSGSGKTTLLRILAGLECAEGSITVANEQWLEGSKALSTQQRGIGFVFQDYALFENMSVEQNLLFVNKDKTLASHLLQLTELTQLKQRLPRTLSGGQKQRVALCRALMRRPKVLLMDEPLSALDPLMRTRLQQDILTLHKEFGTTTIMVSHDPSEIYRLCERVIVLEHGKVIQDGKPKEVLLHQQGSQKFSLQGEILDIVKADIIHVAIVAIGQQIVEVVLDSAEAELLKVDQTITLSTKAFAPTISS